MIFHRRLSDSKSPQVCMRFFIILAYLNNAMVSTHLPICNTFSPLSKSFGTVPSSTITIDITVTLTFHSFLNSLARSKNLLLLIPSFFTLWKGNI